jgi:hypothetical protein
VNDVQTWIHPFVVTSQLFFVSHSKAVLDVKTLLVECITPRSRCPPGRARGLFGALRFLLYMHSKCEFKPKETSLIVKSSSDLAKNVAFRSRVRKLDNEGWSIEKIRKKLNMTRETVRTILKSFEK